MGNISHFRLLHIKIEYLTELWEISDQLWFQGLQRESKHGTQKGVAV